MRPTQACLVVLCMLQAGCGTGWMRAKPDGLVGSPKQQVVRVWSSGHHQQWHGIRVTPDSVSGVPFFQDTQCAECRRSIARVAVDSIQVAKPDENSQSSLSVFLAVLLGVMLAALSQMSGMQ